MEELGFELLNPKSWKKIETKRKSTIKLNWNLELFLKPWDTQKLRGKNKHEGFSFALLFGVYIYYTSS